jgi:glycyl-tRNA synthetase
MLTMQDALLVLTRYWTERGCIVTQPMNTEVGAGTLNPATFLRVLGPEPWRVAYVEPSVRPDDARYGENPNRLQTHTQFQVILKPEPGDPQEQYLGSLEALGIDLRAHDVRFVEDNWAAPGLGAWGLGWEVWLDGLEITQFTYFQQAGGLALEPVSVELTYGMERIVMALQGVTHFKDIAYAPGVTYGEAFGQAEYEMSRYYLDDADVDANRRLFEVYAAEARRLIDLRLPVPAHTYVLKCSHTFNVLDSRGAVSTTDRARAFGRMRALAHEVAELWAARREELGYPLGVTEPPAAPAVQQASQPAQAATLAFEIGVEELPAGEVLRTGAAVAAALRDGLAGTDLGHGEVRVLASPRRVIALVDGVEPREPDSERVVRGPRAGAAYDAEGRPTKAAEGFARGQGVDVGELQRLSVDGGDYVGVVRQVRGRGAVEVLSDVLPQVVTGLRAERNMRWSAPGLSFARPIRWLLALLGDAVVPVTVSSLTSGRTTQVFRNADQPIVEVPSGGALLDVLAAHGVMADFAERRAAVVAGAQALAGHLDVEGEAALLDEIANLVERPTPILGSFDERYLELPSDVLVTVMRKHQRYLPLRDRDGRLLPKFVAVANGDCDVDAVRAGNEAVLRARYEDALFFYRQDTRTTLEAMKAGLAKLTFEPRLGSMADRAERIAALAADLGTRLDLDPRERPVLERAGQLAKFDLGSSMVVELSSLAGVMAREYARRAGEPEPVARALFEMELPRSAGDRLPRSLPGALLSLADRLDLLAGLFGLDAAPTGSSDPFGLRRAALGVISVLRDQPRLAGLGLDDLVAAAAAGQPIQVTGQARAAAVEFAVRRYEQQLLDAGHDHRLVQAVLPLATSPFRADAALTELTKRMGDAEFGRLVPAIQRIRRLVGPETAPDYDPGLFVEPAERSLDEALAAVRQALAGQPGDLATFADAATLLVQPIETYFVDVLVMADDPAVRANRLAHLAAIRRLADPVLDWDALD